MDRARLEHGQPGIDPRVIHTCPLAWAWERGRLRNVYEPVHLELMGRHGDFGVVDIDESVPNRLGQIPLEYLDFVVDSKAQALCPNPAHGGKQMSEEY